MRILHTSDWHLGKNFYSKKLTSAQLKLFESEFFPLIKDVKPDVVIVSGDIMDKPNPDYESQQLFKEILYKLGQEGILTILILGNHDSKRVTLYKEFLQSVGLFLIDDLSWVKTPLKVTSKKGENVYFYCMPYMDIYELREGINTFWKDLKRRLTLFTNKEEVELSDLFKQLVYFLNYEKVKKPAVFIGHFAIEKGEFTGEESSIKTIGMEELVPVGIFKDFDLMLMGHLHRVQKLFNKVYYSGTPMPYSFEEAEVKKGVWLIELKCEKVTKEEFVPLSSPVRFKVLKGKFNELIRLPKDDSYIKVVLEDETPILHPFERLRSVFPNLLVLEYENQDKIVSSAQVTQLSTEEFFSLNEEELFKNFYFTVENKAPSSSLLDLFRDYLEEFKKASLKL